MKKIKLYLSNLKNKKRAKAGLVALCAILIVGGYTVMSTTSGNAAVSVDYTELRKTNLTNSISVKGIVESEHSRKVYSNLNYTVKEVYVEVGDTVTEGSVLAQLDTEDLERSIAQKREDRTASEQSNQRQLVNNQRILTEASSNLSSGTNSQIANAEASLTTAELNLKNAQKAYDDAVTDNNNGINTLLTSAQSSLETIKIDLDKKQSNYEANKVLHSVGGVSLDEMNKSEQDLNNVQIQYNDALLNIENAKSSDTRSLEQAKENLETAQTNYDNAVKSLNSARTAAQQDIENYRNSVGNAQIAVNNNSSLLAIEDLEKQLEDSTIRSPIDGVVTAKYATEGASGQGLLFVIEKTDDLKVITYIKEYDVSNVKEGMKVIIRSDATGNMEYEGVLSKIEPAAVKNSSGGTANSSDVEFGAEIMVVSSETDLKIGMNTRMSIILESKDDVYCVPFESVRTDSKGVSTVFIVDDDGSAKETIVKTGMETDFFTEIEGDELYDGVKIASNISGMRD